MKRRLCLLALLCPVLLLLPGCAPRLNSVSGFVFDTFVTIDAYADSATLKGALDLCSGYDALFSKTAQGSDVWRINHSKGKATEVDGQTAYLIERALYYGRLTCGALDITIAPASALWDFHSPSPALPDPLELARAAALTDYSKVVLSGNTVTLPPGMSIDLGGIAKGYIADKLLAYFHEKGVCGGVINLGGNTVTFGTKNGALWRIGLENPLDSSSLTAVVETMDASIVTSAVNQRGFDLDGVRYHHILDPKTGMSVQNGLAGVTILSASSLEGDALSTACFVLGYEKASALLESLDGPQAFFVFSDGSTACTQGMEGFLAP